MPATRRGTLARGADATGASTSRACGGDRTVGAARARRGIKTRDDAPEQPGAEAHERVEDERDLRVVLLADAEAAREERHDGKGEDDRDVDRRAVDHGLGDAHGWRGGPRAARATTCDEPRDARRRDEPLDARAGLRQLASARRRGSVDVATSTAAAREEGPGAHAALAAVPTPFALSPEHRPNDQGGPPRAAAGAEAAGRRSALKPRQSALRVRNSGAAAPTGPGAGPAGSARGRGCRPCRRS